MDAPTTATPAGPRGSAAGRLFWIAVWAAASVHFARLLPLHLPELPAGGALPALAGLEGLWAWREVRLTGAIPLWNPFVPGGAPLVGAGQFHPLYPTGALALVMDWPLAVRIDFGAHLLAAAMAAAMLARRLRAAPVAAGFAGLLTLLAIAALTARVAEGRMLWRALALLPLAPLGAMAIARGERAAGALAVAIGVGSIGLAGEFGVVLAAIAAAMVPLAARAPAGLGRNEGALGLAIAVGVAMGAAGWMRVENSRPIPDVSTSIALVSCFCAIGIRVFTARPDSRRTWSVFSAVVFGLSWGAALWLEASPVSLTSAQTRRVRDLELAETRLDRLDFGEATIRRLGPMRAYPIRHGQWAPPDQPGRMIQPVGPPAVGSLHAFVLLDGRYRGDFSMNLPRLTAVNVALPVPNALKDMASLESLRFDPRDFAPSPEDVLLGIGPRYLRQIKAKIVLPNPIGPITRSTLGTPLFRLMQELAIDKTEFNALELTYALASEEFPITQPISLPIPARDMELDYELKRFAPGEIEIDYSARLAGLAHVAEPDLPGWRVTIDGTPAREWPWPEGAAPPPGATLPGEGFFINVALPAGRHALRLSYDPMSWRLGVYLTLLGLGAAGALAGRAAGAGMSRARPPRRARDPASVLRSQAPEARPGAARFRMREPD